MLSDISISDGEVIVYPSRWRLVLSAAGAAFFVVLGILIAVNQKAWGVSLVKVVIASYVGTVFFGFCACYAIYRLAFPRPALVIKQDGIFDNSSAIGVGFVEWNEIQSMRLYTFKRQAFLGIIPKDLDAVLSRVSSTKAFVIKANLKLGCAPISIPQAILPVKVDELAAALSQEHDIQLFIDD